MELTKSKLNKIIKKYKHKLEQHERQWEEICKKNSSINNVGDKIHITTPSHYEHERHNAKGSQLFRDIMIELQNHHVFPKKKQK